MDITVADFVRFCERTINGMHRTVDRLDDETVNLRPDVTGANTAYQVMIHALAACEWWTAHIVCGHPSTRDRAGEFEASGSIADLHSRAEHTVRLLHRIRPELEAATTLAHDAQTTVPLDGTWTVGAALLHAYEELAQHLGHLDITVDLVASP